MRKVCERLQKNREFVVGQIGAKIGNEFINPFLEIKGNSKAKSLPLPVSKHARK